MTEIRLGRYAVAIPPLVERELLAGGSRRAFFWLRGALALVAWLLGYDLLNHGLMAPVAPPGVAVGPGVGGGEMLQQMSALLFIVSLLMGLMGADSINRERREGTLGLLLLTGLTPLQIVLGKLLSCGVTSFLVLLGALPALVFPVLVGGARGSDGILIALGLLNALFVSLAAGLWMSALFRERRYAIPATLALVGALAFGAELGGVGLFGAGAVGPMRLLGLGGWITCTRLPIPLLERFFWFALWFVLVHAFGWLLLLMASTTLAGNWQDKPSRHRRPPPPPDLWADWTHPLPPPVPAIPAAALADAVIVPASPLPDPRPWDADPIRWRMEQLGSPQGIIWLAVLADFMAQFGTLGGIFNGNTTASSSWGLLSFSGAAVMVLSSSLLAWAGARFFQHASRQQDLELLLTTPVGGENILSGQWRVLWHGLRWPLCLVVGLVLPASVSLVYDLVAGHSYSVTEVLPAFLVGVNLALEAMALCWVGVAFGLRARSLFSAILWTVGVVQLLPLALAIGGLWVWASLGGSAEAGAGLPAKIPPVVPALLFFLVKNTAFSLWTPFQLRRDLRVGTRAGVLKLPGVFGGGSAGPPVAAARPRRPLFESRPAG